MIKVGPALMEHAEQLERERGIPRDVIIDSLKEAMVAAYKRYAKLLVTDGYVCHLNERTGEIGIYKQEVVFETLDPENEEIPPQMQITLKDARKLKADAEIGEVIETDVTPDEFGRIAAQSAKQVITQRIREAEKQLIQKEYEEKKQTVVTAVVQRVEGRNTIVNIGKTEALLPPGEQLSGEYYRVGNKLRVFILDLRESGRVPQIIVSQGHPAMVKEVFELEVPEIEDGIVEIKTIAREAGFRTKVAVTSHDPDVDPQGACIGSRGSRIQAIVNELRNEKIDIIRWSEDPAEFIVNALAPARIVNVYLSPDPDSRKALVVVPDDQLSLAIGREGQNVRLAAKLTGYKLDIKSVSQFEKMPMPEMAPPPAAAEGGPEPVDYDVDGTPIHAEDLEGVEELVAAQGAEAAETAEASEETETPEAEAETSEEAEETPAEEPAEGPADEEPAEEPNEEPSEESDDEPAEAPVAEDEPAEEEPTEEPAEEPIAEEDSDEEPQAEEEQELVEASDSGEPRS